MLWIILAFVSAFSAAFVTIFAKLGMKGIDSNLGTFLRTAVVLVIVFFVVLFTDAFSGIGQLTAYNWIFIILSGLSTSVALLCFYRALQLGSLNKVVPVDKMSTVFTVILALIIFGEPFGVWTVVAIVVMVVGTILMLEKKDVVRVHKMTVGVYQEYQGDGGSDMQKEGVTSSVPLTRPPSPCAPTPLRFSWLFYAILSLVFSSATAIFAKFGMQGMDSNLATMLRTGVVLLAVLGIVLGTKKFPDIKTLTKKNWLFITLSGIATGISWLCYFYAIQIGLLSVVAPIDRLSVVFAVIFSFLIFKEKLSPKAILGLVLLVCGTLLMFI